MARTRKDPRHRAREAALQILYQWHIGGRAVETVDRMADIDPLIADTAERWRPERMAVLDRLILRMAVCEMLRARDTPAAIVINESLELARTFSAEESVKF